MHSMSLLFTADHLLKERKLCLDFIIIMVLFSNNFNKASFISFVAAGVYLSKYSDLLQINPFEVGSSGDMIVFKVMKVQLPFFLLFVMLTDF